MGKPGFIDYYRVLDISPDATNDEVRAAYRRMAMLVHPDRNKNDPEALEHMTMVNEAWAILNDTVKRSEFDLIRGIFYTRLNERQMYEQELIRQKEEYEAQQRAWHAEQERIQQHERSRQRQAYEAGRQATKSKSKRGYIKFIIYALIIAAFLLIRLASMYSSPTYPDPPSNISFNEASNGSYMDISWNRSTGSTHYQVYTCLSTSEMGCRNNYNHTYKARVSGTRYRLNIDSKQYNYVSAIIVACGKDGCPPFR